MEFDKLVALITEQVFNNIKQNTVMKKKILLLSKENNNKIQELLGSDFDLEYYEDNIDLNSYEHIICPSLCTNGLASLALGMSSSKMLSKMIEAIFMGKNVIVLEDGMEYRKFKGTAPKTLYKTFLEYEEKVRNFGVRIVQVDSLKIELNQKKSKNNLIEDETAKHNADVVFHKEVQSTEIIEVKDSLHIRNKKLIAESDLRKVYMNGVRNITIDKKSILTPLAKDFVRIYHLNITRA